jgi:CRISPR-associated exonuclease Cas4
MSRFRVSDLKQYAYCPRIVYFQACLPDVRPTTFKMAAGTVAGLAERNREERRSLRRYGLTRGAVQFDVPVTSARLGLRGRVDMAIQTDDNTSGAPEAIPVDYKLTPGALPHHYKLQLAAYGMLLEEAMSIPARRGFLYRIPIRRATEIPLSDELRREVEQVVRAMSDIVDAEAMPAATRQREKCRNCEFRRFCNDV